MPDHNTDHSYDGDTDTRRDGPSFPLLIIGILALALSIWTLIGPATWPVTSMIPIGWIVLAGAIVIGLLLVVAPGKRR